VLDGLELHIGVYCGISQHNGYGKLGMTGVWFPVQQGVLSPRHCSQTGSGYKLESYSSMYCRGLWCLDLDFHSPTTSSWRYV